MTADHPPDPIASPRFGPIVVGGFAAALALWSAWYILHLPWLGIPERVSVLVLVAVWSASLSVVGWSVGKGRSLATGAFAGLLSALLGLLVLLTRITEKSAAGHTGLEGSSLTPNAALVVAGFLVLGTVLGVAAGWVGASQRRSAPARSPDWLARFAILATVTSAPLVFAGGLVTSANAGMAVPDWPNTFGSNMFLYPLGPRVSLPEGVDGSKVYLEHFHRLFGTLLGLTSLVLMVWVLRSRAPKGAKVLAASAFLLVCAQGVLGGLRVRLGSADPGADQRFYAIIHGVLGQATLGLLAWLAATLHPSVRAIAPATLPRRARILAAAAMHSTFLQLIFGAVYRHTRSSHALWTHIGFALLVTFAAVLAGLAARSEHTCKPARRLGGWIIAVVILQFLLGGITFMGGGKGLGADTPVQALLRTAHQANGALLLALAAALWVICRRAAAPAPQASSAAQTA